MHELLLLLSSLAFYFLGRHSHQEDDVKTGAARIKKVITQKLNRTPGGVIDFVTPKEMHYRGSEQERIDQKWAENMKKAGLK